MGNLGFVLYVTVHVVNPIQGRSKGRAQGARAPKAPSNFFTNIILHYRVLCYKFTDIAVMFLSRDLRRKHCGPFRWLCSPQTAFYISRQKWLETENDEWMMR